MASDVAQNRNQMRIALVGVRPADQITLKGYLRVLLRLDVGLEWVAATDFGIDLFMINNEFRGAGSINKLLETNANVPVLYVARNEVGDGGIQQNLLTLPLKQINLLNDWLIQNVQILRNQARPVSASNYTNSSHYANSSSHTSSPTPNNLATQPKPSSMPSNISHANINHLIDIIDTLQDPSKALYELVDNGQSIAIIDAYRQMIWAKNIPKLSSQWQLKPYIGQSLSDKDAKDSADWLWQATLQSDVLIPFIDNTSQHQIRYWAKPTEQNRRHALAVMTAIEATPRNVAEIAQITKAPMIEIKRIIAALLMSGSLQPPSYKALQAKRVAQTPKPTTPIQSSRPIQPNQSSMPSSMHEHAESPKPPPTSEQVEQKEEKLGFLARLRRKLGL